MVEATTKATVAAVAAMSVETTAGKCVAEPMLMKLWLIKRKEEMAKMRWKKAITRLEGAGGGQREEESGWGEKKRLLVI